MKSTRTVMMENDVLAALGRSRAVTLTFSGIKLSIRANAVESQYSELRHWNWDRRLGRALQNLRRAGKIERHEGGWRETRAYLDGRD